MPCLCMSGFTPMPHCFDYSNFVTSLRSGHMKKSYDCLNIGSPWIFSTTILGIFSISVKTSPGFGGHWIESAGFGE